MKECLSVLNRVVFHVCGSVIFEEEILFGGRDREMRVTTRSCNNSIVPRATTSRDVDKRVDAASLADSGAAASWRAALGTTAAVE